MAGVWREGIYKGLEREGGQCYNSILIKMF